MAKEYIPKQEKKDERGAQLKHTSGDAFPSGD